MKRLSLVLIGWLSLCGGAALAQQFSFTNSPVLPPVDMLPTLTSTALLSLANLSGYVPDDKYKIRPGDTLSFQILEDREAPKSLMVTDSGELNVPYVGRVVAADKTCKQLADELKSLLEKAYHYRATVVIALDTANKFLGRVYVVGQVRQQGAIEMQVNDDLTVAKAILRAGGLGDFANTKKIKLIRAPKEPGGTNQVFVLNMAEVFQDGKLDKDMAIKPDDFIIVPTRLINF